MSLDRQSPQDFEPMRERPRVLFFEHRDVVDTASEIIESKDPDTVLEYFRDLGLVENMVVQKGKRGEFLDTLTQSFDILLRASSGKKIEEMSAVDMQKLVDAGLPPLFFSELAGAYFHLKNDLGYRIAGMLADENGFGSNVAAANALNCLASYENRRAQFDRSRLLNRRGLELVKDGTTPEEIWQLMKISHGQIDTRSRVGVHADMVQRFEELLAQRIALRDANHVGRTEFEIARLCFGLGELDKALEFSRRTLESATKTHYSNLEVDAEILETNILRAMGDYTGSRKIFSQAKTSGHDLGVIRALELQNEEELLEKCKVSVYCQVQFPSGKYLISKGSDGIDSPVLIELTSGKNVEGAIREELEKLLLNLRRLSGTEEGGDIKLSVRNTRLKFQYKENIGTEETPHRNIGYAVFLPDSANIASLSEALDKSSILGYVLVAIQ